VSVPEPSLPGLAIGAAGVVGFLCPRSWHRWLTLIGLAGILLKFPDRPAPGAFDLAVLDVGHGLAIIVRTATRSLVYDAGPVTRNGFDAGHEIVVPALGRLSAHRLDLIVVSHGDSDHAGGLPALRDAYPATPLIAGPDVAVDGATVCAAGDRWRWDGVDFRVLHPASGFSRRGNDSSCVLLITAGTNRVLLTGDIERDAERELVTAGVPRTAVVLAPHHGSSTSSSAALVDATQPTHVIASAAFRNRWNFPRPDVVERWQSAGGRMHSTGESGAVSVRVSAAGVRVESLRETRRRYWAADSGTGPGSAL
jgi:competence protein ComEC